MEQIVWLCVAYSWIALQQRDQLGGDIDLECGKPNALVGVIGVSVQIVLFRKAIGGVEVGDLFIAHALAEADEQLPWDIGCFGIALSQRIGQWGGTCCGEKRRTK